MQEEEILTIFTFRRLQLGDTTGTQKKKSLNKLLEEWKIYSRVIGMVFDTTASNTGKGKGAAALLEKDRKAALLWLSCRHHVYKVHVKHDVADLVLGPQAV